MTTRERVEEFMKSDFLPTELPEAQYRVAAALEYIAYHMGQIDTKLEQIIIELRNPPRG